jgi:phosphoribosylanthranilate isomerase
MTWVKICGMTNLEDALTAVDAGADAVGFVFYEKSPRNISVEAAREIVRGLPDGVEKVGVFVNETPERVSAIADEAGLTAVQLHGDEYKKSETYAMERKVFLCVPAEMAAAGRKEAMSIGSVLAFPKSLRAVMLDSSTSKRRGGTGDPFNWRQAKAWVFAVRQLHPVVIAGGLRAENVGEAMGILKPWGVDVVSGVEARPGKKDPEKVRAFVKAVRDADRRAS